MKEFIEELAKKLGKTIEDVKPVVDALEKEWYTKIGNFISFNLSFDSIQIFFFFENLYFILFYYFLFWIFFIIPFQIQVYY